MFPNLTWPYDSEFPRSNWNFKFPVSMTRRRNHMFENTSCPCFHQNLTNVMLRSYFIFVLNSIFYCFELIYQKFPKRQNTKGKQTKDKIEPECIHFSAKRLTGMLSKYSFLRREKYLMQDQTHLLNIHANLLLKITKGI